MIIIKKIKYKDYLYQWLLEKKNYVKESTYANYSNIIFNYIIPRLGEYYLENINHDLIKKYILDLSKYGRKNKTCGLSIKAIKDVIPVLKESIRKAFDENKIKIFNLKFNFPKDNKIKSMYVLSKKEQNIIMKYVLKNLNNKNIGILISLFLGIRIGELCALKWEDIDFNKNILHINKTLQRIYIKNEKNNTSKIIITMPKSQNSSRDIPINKEFSNILKKLKNKNNSHVLTGTNKYIEPRKYRYYFNNMLNTLGINHFNFHCLRHTFATNCISLGIDYKTVSELLGHSNVNITLNLYVHPRLSEKQKCIDTLYKNLVK